MPKCIILIAIDCLRADHLSCYGYNRPTTPTIDRLAQNGILWENAHSSSSWTKPSVASLFTGLFPTQHGVFQGVKRRTGKRTTTDVLQCAHPTLAELLSRAGWRCAAFINNAQLGEFTRLDRGFSTYVPTAGKADRLLGIFFEWLEAAATSPVFAYLHFLEAHWPYKPRRRHVSMFGGDRDTNLFRNYSARDYGKLRRSISRGECALSKRELRHMIQMYDGAIRRIDGKLRIILAMLSELGLRDDTALFVTADHGEEFLEHGKIGHGHSLYNELIHVPLVGTIPDGPSAEFRAQPVSLVELPRTLASIAGLNGHLPGRDLLANDAPQPVVAELRIQRRYMQALRAGDWKLHRRYRFDVPDDDVYSYQPTPQWARATPHRVEYELYNVSTDPQERIDLAGDANFETTRQTLIDQLDRWWQNMAASCPQKGTSEEEIDNQVVQRLRDLGYIE